jgi:hypothetical protein
VGLARRSGHEHGGFSTGGLQLRVSRRALVRRCRVEPCTRGGTEVIGHALDVGLGQLGVTGADEPGLLADLVPELLADALGGGAESGDLW